MANETVPTRDVGLASPRSSVSDKQLPDGRGKRGRSLAGGCLALLAVVMVGSAGAAAGGSTLSRSQSSRTSGKTTPSTRKADDSKAEANINLALTAVAIDYQTFDSYDVVNPIILGNLDHALRMVRNLKASGSGQTFRLSVRSASRTTYSVSGDHFHLRRTCTPVGPDCAGGTWPGAATLTVSKGPALTATEKAKVIAILTANVNHYAAVLTLGEKTLGTTQYATAQQGNQAFNNPNSAASRFSAFQKTYDPAGDESYLAAFKKADSYYTAANEPSAITTWEDDMTTATGALAEWVPIAVGWQIHQDATAQLHGAEQRIQAGLSTARKDIAEVLAESR